MPAGQLVEDLDDDLRVGDARQSSSGRKSARL
jgi:hypothetical protein